VDVGGKPCVSVYMLGEPYMSSVSFSPLIVHYSVLGSMDDKRPPSSMVIYACSSFYHAPALTYVGCDCQKNQSEITETGTKAVVSSIVRIESDHTSSYNQVCGIVV
jgi:hypothetical protein